MSPTRSRSAARAFTLLELMLTLAIAAIVAAGIAMPLAAQVQLRRYEETRRGFDEAREALLGFAVANARLPCPASETSAGLESFAPGGDASNGDCSNFYDGFLPGAALVLAPLDAQGFVRDAWQTQRNRIRYAVFGGGAAVNGVVNPLTRANGMQAATLGGIGNASHFVFICSSAAGTSGSGCGPASNQLTRRAAFVLLSLGPNAPDTPPAGSDEARNLSGEAVFVSREMGGNAGFDDLIQWVPVHIVVSRLVVAGRLP